MLTEAELRQKYRDEGWGQLAEELGLDPINTESMTRRVLEQIWAKRSKLNRYFFVGDTTDGESADCMIDAEGMAQARRLFTDWCQNQFSEKVKPRIIYVVPQKSMTPKVVGWGTDMPCVYRKAGT